MALKESDKKALGFLAVALVIGGIWMFVIPMYDEHEKRLQDIENLVQELRVAHKKAENMGRLLGEVDMLKYRIAELKKVLPAESGSFELIEQMQQIAARSGIAIKGITVEDRRDRGEGWKTDGLNIQFSCYWYQLIEFIWRLENYERLVDVVSISITPEAIQPGVKLQRFVIVVSANIYSSTLTTEA